MAKADGRKSSRLGRIRSSAKKKRPLGRRSSRKELDSDVAQASAPPTDVSVPARPTQKRTPAASEVDPVVLSSGQATGSSDAGPKDASTNEAQTGQLPEYTRDQLRQDLLRGVITQPLLGIIQQHPDSPVEIIIALNEYYKEGVAAAGTLVDEALNSFIPKVSVRQGSENYVFVKLLGQQVLDLAKMYRAWLNDQSGDRQKVPIYRVWLDEVIRPCLTKTIATIKADACHRAFCSLGEDIVWAVLDSGIQADHPHFAVDLKVATTAPAPPTASRIDPSLSRDCTGAGGDPLTDPFGHGTHVAGIIAGGWKAPDQQSQFLVASEEMIEGSDNTRVQLEAIAEISGIAPRARLASFKVLDNTGAGKVSSVLLAIEAIQEINQSGRRLRIHGANLSLGYDFNPRWFGCGQSPVCVEVDRLVRSGVAVVVAAGNSGFSSVNLTSQSTNELGYRAASITDPGNANLAITVGATHRDMPHTYGVSYFSSRGPTGDGRLKPDLVAPGERVVSCAAGAAKDRMQGALPAGSDVRYLEMSGTSQAAPHVSGAIAAFLSVRREFIGQPETVKKLFMDNAIDLQRERVFQGSGLLDLLKVLQAV